MTTDTKQTKTEGVAGAPTSSTKPPFRGGRSFGRKSGQGGDRKPNRKFAERPKPEFDQKILSIRRVTRVMAGGRRFSFSVAMLIGDRKGSVGIGLGKSNDTTLAISKAVANARKNMIKILTTKEMSISHDVKAKYKASEIFLMPNKGKGLVAGGAVRDILNLAGMKNVSGKILSRSKNQLNNARAAIKAFGKLKARK
ncbi:MAG: 30S ribosomal protein S5 [Candidatus Paceibacterota bacterium]